MSGHGHDDIEGESVTNAVEGRERYTVNVRYPRSFRSNPPSIANDVQVPTANGGIVPLGEVAKVQLARADADSRRERATRRLHLRRRGGA